MAKKPDQKYFYLFLAAIYSTDAVISTWDFILRVKNTAELG